MLLIPISFVVALLMAIIIIQKFLRSEARSFSDRLFIALMCVYAVQSVLIGLRWGYGILAALPYQAILATSISTLAFLAFQSLTDSPVIKSRWQALHLVPTLTTFLIAFTDQALIGAFISLVFLAYGLALLNMARRGPDILVKSRLDGVILSYRALWITGATLIASVITDIIISFDFDIMHGAYTGIIISIFNTVTLIMLGSAVALTGNNGEDLHELEPIKGADVQQALLPMPQDAEIAAAVDALMTDKALYKDADLNLSRLARRLSLPARQVSEAINRTHKMSVSQYVNNFRIAEACRLLEKTDEPVTQLMFDAGFISKSNFNREFLRITGQSPTQWRKNSV